MTNRRTYKLQLTGLSLLVLVVSFLLVKRGRSRIPLVPYWRYQNAILAHNIRTHGHLAPQSLSTVPSILLINDYIQDLSSSLLVVIMSRLLGFTVVETQSYPFLAFQFVLFQSLLAYVLIKKRAAFVVACLFSVCFIYISYRTLDTIHRVSVAWMLLFLVIYFLTKLRQTNDFRFFVLLIPCLITFIMAYSTLSVIAIVMVGLFVTLGALSNRGSISLSTALLLPVCAISYHLMIFSWLKRRLFDTIVAVTILGKSGVLGTMNLGQILALTGRSADLSAALSPYLLNDQNGTYQTAIFVSLVTIALTYTGVFFVRLVHFVRTKRLSDFDLVFVSLIGQILTVGMVMPLFGGSAAINPYWWFIMFMPLVGTYLVLNLPWKLDRRAVSVLLVIVLLLPAGVTTVTKQGTQSSAIKSVSGPDAAQTKWAATYGDGRVTGDFNTLSTYYQLGGRSEFYIPPQGAPPYTNRRTAMRTVRAYYSKPSTVREDADVYLVTSQLVDEGMILYAGILTKPNPTLNRQLSTSERWDKVYSVGAGSTYVKR